MFTERNAFLRICQGYMELLVGCMRRMTWDGKDGSNLFMPHALEIKEKDKHHNTANRYNMQYSLKCRENYGKIFNTKWVQQ